MTVSGTKSVLPEIQEILRIEGTAEGSVKAIILAWDQLIWTFTGGKDEKQNSYHHSLGSCDRTGSIDDGVV